MIHPSLTKLTDEGAEGCTGSRARTVLALVLSGPRERQKKSPAWTAGVNRGILSCMGRPATLVYEVSTPNGDVLGLVRAPSAGRALRRINELCGVPCTVVGRRVFFAEQHRRDCAGRWQVRSVRLSVKVPNLMTRSYVPKGPTAVFIAQAPHCPALRARSQSSCDDHIHPPISG